jgi:hypothetical protein
MSQLIAGSLQFAEGKRLRAQDNGGGIGARLGLLGNPALEKSIHRDVPWGLVWNYGTSSEQQVIVE